MKQSPIIGALVLLPPIVLILSLMFLPTGCGSSSAGPTPVPTQGTVEIGFTDSPSAGFQSILLNVSSVRLNPSTNPNVAESDPNWIAITVPPGVGAVGDLQIDLNQLQNNVKLFNSGVFTAQTYNQLEVVIDPNNPGSVVPSCSQVPPPFSEGCTTYGMTFTTGSTLRANLTNTIPITVTSNGLEPVIIDFSAGSPVPSAIPSPSATATTGENSIFNYTISPQISVVPHTAFMAAVKGIVTGTVNSGLTINAELTGTDTIIESATVLSTSTTNSGCPSGSAGCFNLSLPAAPATAGGTAYDLYLSGGAANFYALSNQVLVPNATYTPTLNAHANSSAGTVSGVITNAQFQSPIQAATAELLFPSSNAPSTNVVVASTTTDSGGTYTFADIPSNNYTMMVSQSGFDPITPSVTVNSSTITCTNPAPVPAKTCNYGLTSTTISGTVSIDAPGSSELEVMVIAEDSGTTNLENFTMVTIPQGLTQAPFTMAVPTSVPLFDLIASAQDSFQGGAPSQYTGHSIGVLSQVNPASGPVSLGPLDCLGHGSISGVASVPDSGTTVRLFQDDTTQDPPVPVAISETTVGASGGSTAGQFSFCAPPNTYQVQRFENATPVGTPAAVGVMSAPSPAPTSIPCPICSNAQGYCPGLCSNTPLGFTLSPPMTP